MAAPRTQLSTGGIIAVNLATLVSRLLWWLARHPGIVMPLALLFSSIAVIGRELTGLIVLGVLVAHGVWWWRWPRSFKRLVCEPVRARFRLWWIYRMHWQPAMVNLNLAVVYGESEYLPEIKKISCTRYADKLLIRLLAGQAPEDWEGHTTALAHTFGALRCQVRVQRPRWIRLEFFHTDPLTEPIPALPVPASPNFTALAIGLLEDGTQWLLRIIDTHILIGGTMGAGKSSVVWSIGRALCGGIRTGLVSFWGVDPKGGMELTFGAGLFDRLAYATTTDMLTLLDDAVQFMKERQARLRGGVRIHTPVIGDPLLVVVVDELAALISYVDRDVKKRASDALQLLLSQGRALGVVVIAAAQDPSKDVIPFRELFPTRIGLRLTEATQVEMILGKDARDRGAECDRIPASLPGVGYVLEGVREPVRVRAAHITDTDLRQMAEDWHYQPTDVVPIRKPGPETDPGGDTPGSEGQAA
jgi:DNA segregation ATPase FtsK/SpoIIIE, S-DNA-T family